MLAPTKFFLDIFSNKHYNGSRVNNIRLVGNGGIK